MSVYTEHKWATREDVDEIIRTVTAILESALTTGATMKLEDRKGLHYYIADQIHTEDDGKKYEQVAGDLNGTETITIHINGGVADTAENVGVMIFARMAKDAAKADDGS